MNNTQLRKYIEKKYWKENQRLNFKTRAEKVKGNYYSQEITIGDYYFCDIITYDLLDVSDLGSMPYCVTAPWGEFIVTVQKFGELTDEDVHQAIGYCLKQLNSYWLFNVCLDGDLIHPRHRHLYTWSTDALRQWNDMIKRKEISDTKQVKVKNHN